MADTGDLLPGESVVLGLSASGTYALETTTTGLADEPDLVVDVAFGGGAEPPDPWSTPTCPGTLRRCQDGADDRRRGRATDHLPHR